ncbi:Integral membrane protein [Frankia sp. AiPs1]|uniref:hypothetical protein n=1 Tax=Frankia sp. AiPa1 TaxID=573492 RepID=UPI00202B02A6|nr:hypothetical protein [Frankia sp. AiPa1]MCL9760369.1 hypothetical protein [Frankia sp. AiPa1]
MSLTQQMTPYGRPPGRRGRTLLFAALAAVVLIAATVGITLTVADDDHGHSSASTPPPSAPTRFGIPSPQPARPATTSPNDPMLLPHPTRTAANGVPLGFPHTPEGAASAAVRWAPLILPSGENHQIDVFKTIDTKKAFSRDSAIIHEDYRTNSPAVDEWYTATPVALRILSKKDANKVTVAVLTTLQGGTSAGTTNAVPWGREFYLAWQDNDWHLDDLEDLPGSLKISSSIDPSKYLAAGWEAFQLA